MKSCANDMPHGCGRSSGYKAAVERNRPRRAAHADLGGTLLPGSPADFGKLIADETEKWGKVVKFAGIRPE
jgi:hypothetical protein